MYIIVLLPGDALPGQPPLHDSKRQSQQQPIPRRHVLRSLTFVHCSMTGRDGEVCRLDIPVNEPQLVHALHNRRRLSTQTFDSWLSSPETRTM